LKKKFRALELVARKHLDSFSSGLHGTLLKDSLIEVDVVREYQPGDKRLDSKSSLKTGKTMSRVFNPERSLNLYIILDKSSSQYTKLDASIITALYMCYLGDMCNEKVGLCVLSDRITMTDITDDYSSIIGTLEKSFNNLEMNTVASAADGIKKVADLSLKNSLVVFISDFCYPLTESMMSNIKKIALVPTNNFLSVALYNPTDWLLTLNHGFNITFRDAETGKTGNYNAASAKTQFEKWLEDLKKKFLQCSSDAVFLDVKQNQFLLPLTKHLMRS
jgi:uncharacterized protein (DUF58 family)